MRGVESAIQVCIYKMSCHTFIRVVIGLAPLVITNIIDLRKKKKKNTNPIDNYFLSYPVHLYCCIYRKQRELPNDREKYIYLHNINLYITILLYVLLIYRLSV